MQRCAGLLFWDYFRVVTAVPLWYDACRRRPRRRAFLVLLGLLFFHKLELICMMRVHKPPDVRVSPP